GGRGRAQVRQRPTRCDQLLLRRKRDPLRRPRARWAPSASSNAPTASQRPGDASATLHPLPLCAVDSPGLSGALVVGAPPVPPPVPPPPPPVLVSGSSRAGPCGVTWVGRPSAVETSSQGTSAIRR